MSLSSWMIPRGGVARNVVSLLFLFGIVPVGLLSLIFFSFHLQRESQGISLLQKEIVERLSTGINASLEKAVARIHLFGHMVDPEKQSKRELEYLAYNFLDHWPEYHTVTIANLEGREVCKVSTDYTFSPSELGDLRNHKGFKEALEGKNHIGDVEISAFSKFPFVRVSTPTTDVTERITGVVEVGMNVAKMWELISKHRIGENRYAYIVDAKGTLIAYQEISSVLKKQDLSAVGGVRRFLGKRTGVSEYMGLGDEKVIGASALIPLTGWGILVEQPVREAYRGLYILSIVFLAVFLLIVLSAVFLGFRFSYRNLVDPVRRLQEEAGIIARGDFGRRIEMERKDELGQLSESFNKMVSDLQQTTVSRDLLVKEIEERKRTEAALRQSEETARALLNGSTSAAYLVDAGGTILAANQRGAELVGRKGDALVGISITALFKEEIGKMRKAHAVEVIRTGNPCRFEDEDEGRHYEHIVYPVLDEQGRVGRLTIYTNDVTEQKRSQERIREAGERFRQLFEGSLDGYAMFDMNATVVDSNSAFRNMLGYSEEELRNKTYKDLTREKWHAMEARILEEQVLKRGYSDIYEKEYVKKDGGVISVEIRTFLVRGKGDQPVGMWASVRDLTERKRAAEAQATLYSQLERAQKMEAIGTLAGGVAHDLNNVLSALVSYPELLLLDLPAESPLRKPLMTIQKSGEKAAAIVQDLLTLARRGVAVMEVVNLNHIIGDYLRSPEFEKLRLYHPEVVVESRLGDELLNIMASPIHASKTVMNLVSNAVEAMPEGGKISISTQNRYVDRPVRGYDSVAEGDYVTLSVSDTGIGISKQDMEKVFEPFYTKKVMGRSGTGLGMAVVWSTVKDHQGYVDMESQEGKGTTITLYFPATRKVAGDALQESIEEYKGRGETILVVDDVEEQREIAAGMLRKLGYEVDTAATGEQTIEYLKTRPADLMVLDMIMDPGIDGLETYRRATELRPAQKAVIVSGFSETGRVKEAQRLGAGAYVKKPYLLSAIGKAVRQELDKGRG